MSARTMRFHLPMPMNRGNARQHWRGALKDKQGYFEECDNRQALGLLPAPPEEPFDYAVLAVTMYLGQPMDDDNAIARLKYPVDWLRTRGYMKDDSKRHIQWAGFPRQIVERGNSYHVEITLTELAIVHR